VIGWVRPAILLPASALTGLNPGQLLAILAHELAHIRRHDFLINGVQRAVECVLFYHPAVWWISGRMRVERERCCDDLAVRVCGDRMVYVNALVALENTREPILALPTAGAGLTDRVRRLLGIQGANRDWQSAVAALVFAVILVSAGMWQPTLAGPATPPRASVPTPQVQTPPAQPTQTPRPSLNPPLNPLIAIATAQNLRASEPAQTQRVTQPPIAASREAARDRLGMLKVEYSAESFVKQAAEGDTIAVKTFLAAGMNINARNEKGSTALMAAAYSGQTETAQALLAAGADPNLTIPGIVSHSALSNAAGRGDIATMKVLIAAGAQVELKVLQQETALISAAYNGQRDAVLLLLDNKANIEARSSSRGTALVAAACEGKSEVARALLERGADARANNGTPPQTNSVLHCAAMRGDPQLMGLLLDKGADINAPGSNGYTPLARAIADTSSSASSDGRRAGALFLIERGADVNIVAGERNADFTSLWLAVSRRQIEIVRALLAKGADPNKMTRQDPPLITALRNVTPESVEIAMLLIDKGADVNATDRNGGMPVLLFAIDAKQPDVVRALLAKGADPNKPNSQNRTPLQTAVGSPEMMQMLINAGAKQ
jgi:ankyrin repeat protein